MRDLGHYSNRTVSARLIANQPYCRVGQQRAIITTDVPNGHSQNAHWAANTGRLWASIGIFAGLGNPHDRDWFSGVPGYRRDSQRSLGSCEQARFSPRSMAGTYRFWLRDWAPAKARTA